MAKKEPTPVEQLNIPARALADATIRCRARWTRRRPPTRRLRLGNRRRRRNRDEAAASVRGADPASVPGPVEAPGAASISLGSGVATPVLLHEVRPQYTSDAMRAKIQGTVLRRSAS